MNDELARRLERFLAHRIPEVRCLRVVALESPSEGFSQETFCFEVETERDGERHRRGYVAKREPVAGLLEPYDLEPEFRVLHALCDVPCVPAAHWFEADGAVLERPFYVMDRLEGEVPIPAAGPGGAGPFSEAERKALGPQVIETLTRLHAIDWRSRGFGFLDPPAPGREAAQRELERWTRRIVQSRLPAGPVVREALLWLHRNVPCSPEVTLVHGDFRLGNWLVVREGGGARLTGVLDWEMVHLGDPFEDVAWCSSPMWRAGTPYAAALLPDTEFLERYGRVARRALDPARLHFYAVLSVVKMIAIELTGLRTFLDQRTRDLRMAIFEHQIPFLEALLAALRGWLAPDRPGGV